MSKTDYGYIEGNLEITTIEEDNKTKIIIHGDPEGLFSLGEILIRLSKQDQNEFPGLPIGAREHIHMIPNNHLSKTSKETIIGRLDAKGTGKFPTAYKKKIKNKN